MPVTESPIAKLYRTSPAERRKLRIGLMIDTPHFMAWSVRILEDIRASNFAELCLVVSNASARQSQSLPRSLPLRALQFLKDKPARRKLFYSRYVAWDARFAPQLGENPLAVYDYSTVLTNIPTIEVTPITQKFIHRFSPDVVAAIRSYDLDVLIRFGFNLIRGDILRAARYGVWSFHHGDNDYYRGGPAHFWELVERHPTTGVILQVLNEELDAGLVLAKGVFVTQQGMFLRRNRYAPYWGTTHFVIQKLYELHRYGWDFVRSKAVPQVPYQGKRRLYRTPNNWETLKWLSRECLAATGRIATRQFRRRKLSSWRMGIRFSKTPLFEEGAGALGSFHWYDAPRGHSFADPIAFEHKGRRWLFVEDFDYAMNKAVISVAEVTSDGKVEVFTPCLTQPYHLSYPIVFAHQGEVFMIPETGSKERVELYRAVRFPFKWKFEKVLVQLRAVDTTPLYHEGRWWFFTSITEPKGWAALSFLFTADTLTGEWTLHPRNPIAYSSIDARGAGPILQWEGRLLRPTQSACPNYGYSFSFHDITQLAPDRFEQHKIVTIDPVGIPHVVGTHSYSRSGDLEAIDACMVTSARFPASLLHSPVTRPRSLVNAAQTA
jgi:hypothetical protein